MKNYTDIISGLTAVAPVLASFCISSCIISMFPLAAAQERGETSSVRSLPPTVSLCNCAQTTHTRYYTYHVYIIEYAVLCMYIHIKLYIIYVYRSVIMVLYHVAVDISSMCD